MNLMVIYSCFLIVLTAFAVICERGPSCIR